MNGLIDRLINIHQSINQPT